MFYLSQSMRLIGRGLRATKLHWRFRPLEAGIHSTSDVSGQGGADETCDVILAVRIRIDADEVMKSNAKDSLLHAFKELLLSSPPEQICIGNPLGLGILAELNSLREQLATKAPSSGQHPRTSALTEKNPEAIATSRDTRMTNLMVPHEQANSTEEAHIRILTSGNEAYQRIRNRYISTFKRDSLDCKSTEDQRIIIAGNDRAHGGDAAVDATLYFMPRGRLVPLVFKERLDPFVFKGIYGVSPEIVQNIKNEKYLSVVNEHADALATGHNQHYKEYTDIRKTLIKKFTHALDLLDPNTSDLRKESTNVACAYLEYTKYLETQKKESTPLKKKSTPPESQ